MDEAGLTTLIVLVILARGGRATQEQIVQDCEDWQREHGEVTKSSVDAWWLMNKSYLEDAYVQQCE